MIQTYTINGWHPETNPNQRTSHWAVARKRHLIDRDTACGALCFAKWQPVTGRARLTIELVYAANRLPDADNATARCKGIIDSIKPHEHRQKGFAVYCSGFVPDDSPEWLDLEVRAVYEKGTKAVRMRLESVEAST